MRAIVGWCLANRSVVLLFGLLLVGAGVFSMFRLNQELLPDVSFPTVYIVTSDAGASPEVVDRDVSVPMADALTGLPHAKHVHSESSQGFSTVWIQFDLDSSLKDDTDAVNQRLNQLALPAGAGKPLVQTFSFSAAPTMTYSLAARDGDLVRATTEAKDVIAPALESVPGVAQVKVVGGERNGVTITLDPVRLGQKQVSPFQVVQALGAAQVDVPAGLAVEGSSGLPVEVLGSVKSVADLRNVRVGGSAAKPVTLGDVADVREGPQPLNGISRTDGSPSLSLQVIKASGGNAVNVSHDVRARIASLHLDEGVDDLQLVEDTATDIQSSLNGLLEEGLLGALLAVLVIWLFLGSLRATLVTAVSLPTSVMVALAATNVAGYSLNVLTLAGLTIAIGRIVDDAIVVLENSYRHLQRGETPREAALNGATEVWAPVVSSTLTTVAVFLPIGTLGGVISKFFLPFSVTVTIALLGSLLVALTLIPVLVSFFLERGRGEAGPGRLVRAYRPALAWSLGRAWRKAAVLLVAAVLLGLSFVPVATGRVPINFLSSAGSGELNGSVVLPPGTTADQTSERLKEFERRAQQDPQVKLVGVTLASTDYGGYSAGFSSNVARLTILIKDRHQGAATRDRLAKVLDDLYGKGSWSLEEIGFVQGGNFQVTLSGRDVSKLRDASDTVVGRLQDDPNLTNVQASLQTEQPELLITVDQQKAAARGLDPQQVAGLVAQVLNPRPLGTLAGSEEPVTLRLADPKLLTPANLALLPLAPGVQLKDVATIGRQAAPVGIEREDGVRRVTVSADFVTQDANGISGEATKRLSNLALPTGVTLTTGGASSDINEAFGEMYQAIAVAIAIVALILVAFFRSVVTPFVILLTMPLALIGGMLALFVTQQPLGLPALMGVLMVFGIVVSNAILLVDFSDRAARTRPVRDALLLAGSIRLRPILMTAVATIVALLPIAVGLSGGGGGLISQSLAVVVEGGLISSTALTLLVIPVVYSLLKRRRAEITVEEEPAAPVAERPPWMHFRESTGP